MRMTRVAAMVMATAVVGTVSVSRAQDDTSSRARRLFLEGRRAADAGDYANACGKFAESSQLEAAAGSLFNLGDCQEQMGRAVTAWTAYRKGLGLLANKDDPRRRHVGERLAALEKRIARVTIRVGPSAPEGTKVELDGSAVDGGALGVQQAAEPGSHIVVATAAGHQSRRYEVTLEAGKATELAVEPEPALPNAPSSTGVDGTATSSNPITPTPDPHSVQLDSAAATTGSWFGDGHNLGIVAGSVGAAGVVVGVVARAMALGKWDAIDAHCSSDGACDRTGMDAVSSAKTLQTVSTVSLIAGAAGLGVGAYLLFGRSNPSATPAQASLGAMVVPGGVGLQLQKGF